MASPSEAPHMPRQIVVFSLGEEEYGLPITQVQEIIRYSEPRAVASHVRWMRGVISLRGQILPVIDLAARLGLGVSANEPGKIIIVETGASNAGVIVDDVQEVLTLQEGETEPLPVTGGDALQAIAKIGDRLVVLLDAQNLFANGELGLAA